MITRVQCLNFKALRYVDVRLSNFQVLVGPNASGKTTFLEALEFLGSLAKEDVKSAVFKLTENPYDLFWMKRTKNFEIAVEANVPESVSSRAGRIRYQVRVGLNETGELALQRETLYRLPAAAKEGQEQRKITEFPFRPEVPSHLPGFEQHELSKAPVLLRLKEDTGNTYYGGEDGKTRYTLRLPTGRSGLFGVPADVGKFPIANWFKTLITEGVTRIVLDSDDMRRPSPPGSSKAFLPDGSNLPWVIGALREDSQRFSRWIEHIQTALPDVKDVQVVERPEDRSRYIQVIYRNGLEAPSWAVSDGTLRLLALTIIAYVADPPGLVLIEEPENGIHPLAVDTVYKSLSSAYDAQVLLATHSPVILRAAEPRDLLCFSKTTLGEAVIVRGDQHPKLAAWRRELDLGDLFATGVLG